MRNDPINGVYESGGLTAATVKSADEAVASPMVGGAADAVVAANTVASSVTADQHRLALLRRAPLAAVGRGWHGVERVWRDNSMSQSEVKRSREEAPASVVQGFWEIEGDTISTRCTAAVTACSGVSACRDSPARKGTVRRRVAIRLHWAHCASPFCNKRFKNKG